MVVGGVGMEPSSEWTRGEADRRADERAPEGDGSGISDERETANIALDPADPAEREGQTECHDFVQAAHDHPHAA